MSEVNEGMPIQVGSSRVDRYRGQEYSTAEAFRRATPTNYRELLARGANQRPENTQTIGTEG